MPAIRIQNTFKRVRPLDDTDVASTRFLVGNAKFFECFRPIDWEVRLDDTYWVDNGGYNPPWAVWTGEKWIGDEFDYAIWLNPIGQWYQGQRPKWVRVTFNSDADYHVIGIYGAGFEAILDPLVPGGGGYDYRTSGEMYELDWSAGVEMRYLYVYDAIDAGGLPATGLSNVEITNIEFGFPNRIKHVFSEPVLGPDLTKKFASQSNITTGVNHSGDGIDIIPPSFVDDDFAGGTGTVADTAKWTTVLLEQYGGDVNNQPLRDGQDLNWYQIVPSENVGEERWRVCANWHLVNKAAWGTWPNYTKFWEIEFIINFDLLNITGQTSYYGAGVTVGVGSNPAGGSSSNDVNEMSRRPIEQFFVRHFGGGGSSTLISLPLLSSQPVINRIAWRTGGGGNTKQSMHLFFDQNDGQWKNAYNQIDTPWISAVRTAYNAVPFIEFSTVSGTRVYTNEIRAQAVNFRLVEGDWSF